MLDLVKITKDYETGGLITHALKGIDVSFRRNEFVSVLGPSGCGKTTLLNIIGGLDRYTSGDLVIKNKSTKNYDDRDWDTYRNHSIGFVFQSYNLISHLTILENVELALTIGGVDKKKRTKLSLKALEKVGLGEIAKKKPNQLSGGQMQRVAIARALVNDPEILLADEPTGALDSETSLQIMELLKEVAKDRLVIMVTHNPDLANKYSSRIITMKDGLLVSDSNPFDGDDKKSKKEYKTESSKKAKMTLKTAFTLSSRNLASKFKRTSLVVVAGSIGIIGISAVLAVSYGVKSYIGRMQDDMLSGNPVQITETGVDLQALLESSTTSQKGQSIIHSVEDGKINIQYMIEYLAKQKENLSGYTIKNDITADYIQFVDEMPKEYYSAIKKGYGIRPKLNIYTDATFTQPKGKVDQVSLEEIESMYSAIIGKTEFGKYSSMISMFTNVFSSMPNSEEYLLSQYDVLNTNGYIAKEENEMMLVVSKDSTLTDIFLGQLGYLTQDEFVDIIDKFVGKQEKELHPTQFTYDELVSKQFVYYPNDLVFTKGMDGIIPGTEETHAPCQYIGEINDAETKAKGKKMKITAILRAKENVSYGSLTTGIVVSPAFEKMVLEQAVDSLIKTKLNEQLDYYNKLPDERKNKYTLATPYTYTLVYKQEPMETKTSSAISIVNVASGGGGVFDDVIKQMFGDQYSIETQFKTAIRKIGGNKLANKLSVYPLSFNDKHLVTTYLDDWNDKTKTIHLSDHSIAPDARKDIKYQDNLEVVIRLINTMIEIVTIALICFTSLSLVVSTVMIGIITYVSVIERIKEIGIIRSLGGRKHDVSNLFNVETFIIGAASGAFGLVVTYIMCLVINIIINSFAKVGTLMILPWYLAILIMGISILLTLVSGLIPASAAAHKDPVVALRTND